MRVISTSSRLTRDAGGGILGPKEVCIMEVPFVILFGVAVLVVLLTSLVKQVEWNHRAKALVATVVSVVAAAAATLATGVFDATNLLQASVALFGLSQAFYHLILFGTPVDAKLEAVGNDRAEDVH